MSARPEAVFLAKGWLEKAAHDLKNAEHTLKLPDSECPFDTVCFHAQQCAEKSLKAFLTFHGVVFQKIHDLKQLLKLCTRATDLMRDLDRIEILTPYAIEARYPEISSPIVRKEAKQAVTLAKRVYKAVHRKLALHLASKLQKK